LDNLFMLLAGAHNGRRQKNSAHLQMAKASEKYRLSFRPDDRSALFNGRGQDACENALAASADQARATGLTGARALPSRRARHLAFICLATETARACACSDFSIRIIGTGEINLARGKSPFELDGSGPSSARQKTDRNQRKKDSDRVTHLQPPGSITACDARVAMPWDSAFPLFHITRI
jgi:hypothetical protein